MLVCGVGSTSQTFFEIFLKVPSLARSVPKPLKMPSLGRSVPKSLKVPSLARSVPKPLKVSSLARFVPKSFLNVPRCRPPPTAVKERSDWSSAASYEYRLFIVVVG